MSTSDGHIDSIESTSSCNEDGAIPHPAVSAPPQDPLLEVEEGSGVVDHTAVEIDEKEEKDSVREELEEYTAQCEERIGLQEKEVLQLQKEIADRDAEISTLKQELAVQAKELDTAHVTVESEIKNLQSCAAGLKKTLSWLQHFPPYTAYTPCPLGRYDHVSGRAKRIQEELQGVYKSDIHVVNADLHNGEYVREDHRRVLAVGFYEMLSSDTAKKTYVATPSIFFAPLHFDMIKREWLDMEEEWHDFVKYNPYACTLVRIQPRQAATNEIEFHITEYKVGSDRELVMRRFWIVHP